MIHGQLLSSGADKEGVKRPDGMAIHEQAKARLLQQAVEDECEVVLHFLASGDEGIPVLLRACLQPFHHTVHVLPKHAGAAGKVIQPVKVRSGTGPNLQQDLPLIHLCKMI
jgi:hypothetical protein